MIALKDHPIVQLYLKHNHFGAMLGMDFELTDTGEVHYRLTVTKDHLATPIAAHGGVICAFMDATMGVRALSNVVLENKVVSTIEMKISFIAPAFEGDQLTGTATILRSGKRLLFVEGQIKNQDDQLIATASGTFNAYPMEKAGFLDK